MSTSWKEQILNSISTVDALREYTELTDEEAREFMEVTKTHQFLVTPYYASLMDKTDRNCPIRKQIMPSIAEITHNLGSKDPLMEKNSSPTPLIVHVYPDRVAFLISKRCATYCRFCIRKFTVDFNSQMHSKDEISEAIQYIRDNPQIRDVLLTGGDPLMHSDEFLEWILQELRSIPHVQIIRIGTRMVCTLPQRITAELCQVLKKYHPIWISVHFNHPKELTEEVQVAVQRLLEAGIPLMNQSVLLRGVNDSVEVMKALVQKLVYFRIKPYYIYQAQCLYGTEHFVTPIERGNSIMRQLRGFTSGYCEPRYVLDTPNGKVPLGPNYSLGRENDHYVVYTWDGEIWREWNPYCVSAER